MDPKRQECFGIYLYGAGYFARDENTLGLMTGRGTKQPHFCNTCPRRVACEHEHERRVRDGQPEATDQFDRLMSEARARGIAPTLAAVLLGKRGLDPYANTAIQNFASGHADRGRKDGPLVA